jgi:hypothetical protein
VQLMLLQDLLTQVMDNQTPGQLYSNDIKPVAHVNGGYANVIDRFLDVVSQLVGMGFYVILDCHLEQDQLTQVNSVSISRYPNAYSTPVVIGCPGAYWQSS